MAYTFPQNKIEIIDGLLRPVNTVPQNLAVVIERSYKGINNQLYLVQDLTEAKSIFGDNSPLINAASEVVSGGAQNVALFRIGGGAYEYANLFGEATTLRLTEESVSAADNIKVYIGPEPKSEDRDCVIVFEGNRIIYSNVLGGETVTRKVLVQGFDKTATDANIRVGTPDNPVAYVDILNNIQGPSVGDLQATKANVDSAEWILADLSTISALDLSTVNKETLKVYLGDEKVAHTLSSDGTKLLINKYVDGTSEKVKENDNIKVTFYQTMKPDEVKSYGVEYIKGKDSMNASYKEIYEELDKALELLELLPTKSIYAGDLFNVPNVANGDTDSNRLEYVIKTENEEGNYIYEWSDKKFFYRKKGTLDQVTDDISDSELDVNAQPIVVKQFNEVDFVHRLGMFAHNKTQDGEFLNITVGARGPSNASQRAINTWIGTKPKRDVINGRIVEDGTGLLGHRLMVGSTKRSGGYFATDNGFVDGNILVDSTGFPVDLGKHISIVVSQVTSVQDPNSYKSAGAAYAGLVSQLQPGNSTTNAVINDMVLITDFRESKRRDLAEAGYVVLLEKPQGLTVYSGDLATRDNSDYDYISTANTMAAITRVILEVTEPYIGKGIDIILLTALKTQLTTALGNVQKQGWMNSFEFSIRRDGPNTLLIPFRIEAKDELRKISSIVRLQQSDLNLQL